MAERVRPHRDHAGVAPDWLVEARGQDSLPDGAATVDRLLLAALESFSHYGYYGTATRGITERATTSRAALYTYFPSKADLLARLVLETHRYIHAQLASVVAEQSTPTQQVEAFLRRHIQFHLDTPSAARVANYELSALKKHDLRSVLKIRHAIESILRSALAEGSASGEFTIKNLDYTQTALLSLTVDVSRWSRSTRHTPTTTELADAYWELARGMLRVKADS